MDGICGWHANAMEQRWRSGDTLGEVGFSFPQLSPGNQTHMVRNGGKRPESLYSSEVFCEDTMLPIM